MGVLLLVALTSRSGHEEQNAYDSPNEYPDRGKCNISRVPEGYLGKFHIGRTRGRKTVNTDGSSGRALQRKPEWHITERKASLRVVSGVSTAKI